MSEKIKNDQSKLDKIVALSKNRGFIFPGSEIYGGLANTWDYGPLGVELKNSIKREWWKFFVQEDKNAVGIDGGILMNPNVWVASGHVGGFSDPLKDCKSCKTRHRADNLIANSPIGKKQSIDTDAMSTTQMDEYVEANKINCPHCGKSDWTQIRQFNLMFKTNRGVTDDSSSVVYLRPETAQAQFVNFQNLQRVSRLKLPFGVGQIGKAFRNEITPGNFTFRTVEFEQMEYQYFTHASTSMDDYEMFKSRAMEFYIKRLGIEKKQLKFKDHGTALSHYAKAAVDAQYNFPFGFGEIGGTHHRGTFDLGNHQTHSGKNMEYVDPVTNEKYIPTVIESSHGCDRLVLAVLCNAYHEETLEGDDVRVVLKLKPCLAPYKVAVLPLQKKDLGEKSDEIFALLAKNFMTTYDETASIGKRYRRQDEIGTPFCVTVDFETLEDDCVTIRYRDTMKQERVPIKKLVNHITKKLSK
ncbi:MAG: glycine--tRNA ligase [Firmicutes bacterium]|nr:glycine--tRNA ligase [Bacillota bacterium]